MYSSFHLLKKYISYYVKASNGKGHGMHSPFVFDFIQNVINNKNKYEPSPEIELARKELLSDDRIIQMHDMGAGSRISRSGQRSVRSIAYSSLKSKKYSQLLYRLVRHYKPKSIIELGTSLGITTSYLSRANPLAEIITIEGNESIAAIANDLFKKLNVTNVQLVIDNFDKVLPFLLQKRSTIDLAYIDGNHRYQPTVNYFKQLLERSQNETIMIFDDIHWSNEMEKAWYEIKEHASVQYTIDLFFLGIVFLKKEFKIKQNFSIRY